MTYLYAAPASVHHSTATLGFLGLDQQDYFNLAGDLRSIFRPSSPTPKVNATGTTSTRGSLDSRPRRSTSFDSRRSVDRRGGRGVTFAASEPRGVIQEDADPAKSIVYYPSAPTSPIVPPPYSPARPYSPESSGSLSSPSLEAFGRLPNKIRPLSPSIGVFDPDLYARRTSRRAALVASAKKMVKRALKLN